MKQCSIRREGIIPSLIVFGVMTVLFIVLVIVISHA